jgi:tryptophan 2,3-dioxygenase
MVRLTIALEDEILERAETKARQEGTSLAEILRSYLESYAGIQREWDRQEATKTLLDLSSTVQSGSGERTWTRDELYER